MNLRRGVGIMGHWRDGAAAWFFLGTQHCAWSHHNVPANTASSNSAQIQANSEATTVFTILIETGSLQKTKCIIFCSAIISQHASAYLCVVLCSKVCFKNKTKPSC